MQGMGIGDAQIVNVKHAMKGRGKDGKLSSVYFQRQPSKSSSYSIH